MSSVPPLGLPGPADAQSEQASSLPKETLQTLQLDELGPVVVNSVCTSITHLDLQRGLNLS